MQHRGFLLLTLLALLALTSAVAKKKDKFGADCKYKFENWGACDGGTGTKVRQGTLKKVRYNAQCQETICVTKPCTPKTKAKAKAKKGKGKD
ncbi:midkine-like isoform X2 [Theropithecus gelada]|uniref:midkine-like isoform X2 n=1 Tax=Theropithecus gelada TaxID=9565 RepID=UPI000DC1AA39|nr:midkine-like isoform X2 [Theropithecus gelada]